MFFTHVVRQQKTTIENKNVVCERGSGTVSSVQDSPDKRHVDQCTRHACYVPGWYRVIWSTQCAIFRIERAL